MAVKCDVRIEEEVVAMFGKVVRELGGVDVLVSNAGLAHCEPLLSGNASGWREMMEVGGDCELSGGIKGLPKQVNVFGLCVCNREFVKQARERGMDDGHIILLNR